MVAGRSADEAAALSLHDALPIWNEDPAQVEVARHATLFYGEWTGEMRQRSRAGVDLIMQSRDRKSTRLNSSHLVISYAVFCLQKKTAWTRHQHCSPISS